MKYALLSWLACPACGGVDLRLDTRSVRRAKVWAGQLPAGTPGYDAAAGEVDEIVEGAIACADCGRHYAIVDGIPRMMVDATAMTPSAHAATSFDANAPAWEEAFLDFADPLKPDDFLGKLCLDVGCGFGRGAFFAARYGAEVVAVDADAEILGVCRDNTQEFARVHVVQADAAHLPFRTAAFDLAYAFGLLHHVQDPWGVFHEISTRVKPGGRLSLWAYGPRQGTAAAISSLLRQMTRDMPPVELLNVSRFLGSVVRVGSHAPYRVLGRVPGMHSVVSHLPLHDHWRWSTDVVVADIYDRLRIPVTHTFTREALERHYVDEGYLDVRTTRRVRNNESFRATGIRR